MTAPTPPDSLDDLRRSYARDMLKAACVADDGLERAFAAVRREDFLGSDPWRIFRFNEGLRTLPTNDPAYAYQDALFVLDEARGVNNGSPSLHARMMHALAVRPGQRVAHIGAGSGYYSAILAELVGPAGRVAAVERDKRLAEIARDALKSWPNVDVVRADGAERPTEETDRIYVNFAVARPAEPWIDLLAEGGRLVFPLGTPSAPGRGAALMIERCAPGFAARWLCPTLFVTAEGALAKDKTAHRMLRRAFERGGVEFVRSLQWGEPAEIGRSWLWTPTWSLSFDPPPSSS